MSNASTKLMRLEPSVLASVFLFPPSVWMGSR